MQLVIQFQKYIQKMNKRNKGITKATIAPLTLFNLSFGQVTRHLNLLPELDDENSVFKYQTSQHHRKKVSICFSSILE